MSSFKNFAPLLTSLQAQADGTGTIAGSPLEDFLSIAGYETPGGGGGGDFSAATVEITNSTGSKIDVAIPVCDEEAGTLVRLTLAASYSGTLVIPLYKGMADLWIDSASVTLTGDIEEIGGEIVVTGDGTITIA